MSGRRPTAGGRPPVYRPPHGEARARVVEFLRQWDMRRGNDANDMIYSVYTDPLAEMADLRASDLKAVVDGPDSPGREGLLRLLNEVQGDRARDVVREALRDPYAAALMGLTVATYLGSNSEWPGADALDAIAGLTARVLPPVGDPDTQDLYRDIADTMGIDHDGE